MTVSAHLTEKDAGCGHQRRVDEVLWGEAVLVSCQRGGAGMQLRERGVLVERLVAVVLRHPPGQAVGKADQQCPPESISAPRACCTIHLLSMTNYLQDVC